MPRNGTGTYTAPSNSWNPPVNGVIATSNDWAATQADYVAALSQSVSSDGQTPMTGNLPMGNNKITGMANGSAVTDAATMGNLNSVAGQAGGVGDRNLLINGNLALNQRGYVSGTATTVANQYTLDRWRVVTSGQSITFAVAAPDRVVTCPAGGLEQPIEAGMIAGGVYTLSWVGTATAKVNGVAITNGGSTTSLPANTQVTVQFASGTVSNAQFELGTTATPYQRRQLAYEQVLCQRYYESGTFQIGSAYSAGGAGALAIGEIAFKATKRTVPTMTQLAGSSSVNVSANAFLTVTTDGCGVSVTQGASVGNFSLFLLWSASAEM